MIERFPYTGTLPERFFTLVHQLYAELPYKQKEDSSAVLRLFELESERNEIIVYMDHQQIRLVGIFPHDGREAHFGFWETTDNLPLNRQAFALLEADAAKRGRTSITGPLDFNTFQRYRLRLAEKPSWGAFDREPINPCYYGAILEQLGFEQKITFESRCIRKEDIPAVYSDKKLFLEELEKIPYDFVPVTPEVWQQFESEIFELVQHVFGSNPAYKPVSREQFNMLYNNAYAQKLCPYSSVLFRHRASGRFAAMSFCHPNYQPLLLPVSVSPTFAQDYPRLAKKVLLAKSVGVHPDFRGQGLMNYLGAYGMLCFQELYEEVIFCLMRSDNYSTHFTDMLPYESARYALFEKPVSI
ncbi:hypothetical protein DXT99_14375 [Pontibacter diazotrophicus]|uniref:GNAT family N-acetyltransferase n=1 Tax=Pontibacter diazotrophicus TaxID=1400979 RepID=A0A3D8LB13_9BACT|nr:hypothetical protein [Pontibacter diazotrophicus]RDV14580.1 hypothetical protein DXT99_14375 [Pontibacter diazotrophicus]